MRKMVFAALVSAGATIFSVPASAVTVDFVGPGSTYLGGGGSGTVAVGGTTNFLFQTTHFVSSPIFTGTGLTSAGSYSFAAPIVYSNGGLLETEFFNILLNGIQIGAFSVAAGTGTTTISGAGSFAPIDTSAGIQLTYRVASNVTPGFGSVSFIDNGSTFSLFDASAVPEPASWAMLISGFGLVGGAMRRRQKVNVSYAA